MTTEELRDHFAGQAMHSLLASSSTSWGNILGDVPNLSYQMADAMLKAREPKQTPSTEA